MQRTFASETFLAFRAERYDVNMNEEELESTDMVTRGCLQASMDREMYSCDEIFEHQHKRQRSKSVHSRFFFLPGVPSKKSFVMCSMYKSFQM